MADTIERAAVDGPGKASKPDAFTPWYTIWCGAFLLWNFVVGYLDDIYNFYLAIVLIIFFPLLVLAGTLFISLVVNIFRRHWRRTISIIAAPIIALLFFGMLGRMGITPSRIRLELSKSSYMAQVDALPDTDGPRLKCWGWGATGGVAVATIFRTLVYDESDQIALAKQSWSNEWLRKVDQVSKSDKAAAALNLVVHPERIANNNPQVTVGHL